MPAGLSQITQSNFSRSSPITRATPSSVSASLSRVCEAGRIERVSRRLSRIKSLGQLCVALHYIDKIKHDPSFSSHNEIEIAEAHVKVDNDNILSTLGKRSAQCSSRGRLSNAAFS